LLQPLVAAQSPTTVPVLRELGVDPSLDVGADPGQVLPQPV